MLLEPRVSACLLGCSAPLLTLATGLRPGDAWQATGPLVITVQQDPRTGRSLRLSIAEGMVAELVGACASGAVLTAWALYLALPATLIGLLGALPFASQLVHLPGAFITGRLGHRRAALLFVALSRQIVLPLALLPFLPISQAARQAALLVVAGLAAALGVIGNNAWTAWMGDLVPEEIRGRYFGRRSAACALGAALGALAAGLLLDLGQRSGGEGLVLAGFSLGASLAGLATFLLMRAQHESLERTAPAPRLREVVLVPLRDWRARRVLAFQIAWSAAGGLAAAFYPLYMITELQMGFARMALYSGGLCAFRVLAAPLWGRALDHTGARPILVACAFGLSLSPLLWLFPRPDLLWPLALDAALCGTLSAGYNLAAFSLPLSLSQPRDRAFHLAAFAATGGLAMGLASALSGPALHLLPSSILFFGQVANKLQLLFLLGGGARILSALLGLRIVQPGSANVAELGKLALNTAARRARQQRRKLAA